MAEHTRSEVDEFDSSFGFVFEEHIFWFEIRMDDGVFSQKYQGIQDLNRESSNMLHFNWSEMVGLDQVVQADAEQFCYNAIKPLCCLRGTSISSEWSKEKVQHVFKLP